MSYLILIGLILLLILPFTKGLRPGQIKKEANDAINSLQQNVSKNQKGDLTLSEIENEGKMSISEDVTGELSDINYDQ